MISSPPAFGRPAPNEKILSKWRFGEGLSFSLCR
jgi:hypothetical protein